MNFMLTPETAKILSELFFNVYEQLKADPFALFAFLACIIAPVFAFMVHNQPAWLKLAAMAFLFTGLVSIGVEAFPRSEKVFEPSTDALQPFAVPRDEAAAAPLNSEITPRQSLSPTSFNNTSGYILNRPETYSENRAWFTHLVAYKDKERAVAFANDLSTKHGLMSIVFQTSDREHWTVAIATWTTEEKARMAAQYANDKGIVKDAYAKTITKEIFDDEPYLYSFRNL